MADIKEEKYSEPGYAAGDKDLSSPWYLKKLDEQISLEARKLFLDYAKVPPDHLSKHIHNIRDKAWQIRSYPCTGLGLWLAPSLTTSPAYSQILEKLRRGGLFVDVGTFIGQALRQLAFEGIPSSQLYGIDIVSHWKLGYECFRDGDTFKGHYMEADILADPPTPALKDLEGKVEVILINHVFHQWRWDTQVKCAKRLARLSKGKGSLVVGMQVGHRKGQELVIPILGVPLFHHDPKTWSTLWEQVGLETNTKWETKAELKTWDEGGWDSKYQGWQDEGGCLIQFVVTRSE